MTARDLEILEAEATHSALMDDGFTEKEADEIVERILNGEDVNEVVLEYRPEYNL